MSEYSEYQDRANGVGKGKHAKDEGGGCMVVGPLPAALVGMVVAALFRAWRRSL